MESIRPSTITDNGRLHCGYSPERVFLSSTGIERIVTGGGWVTRLLRRKTWDELVLMSPFFNTVDSFPSPRSRDSISTGNVSFSTVTRAGVRKAALPSLYCCGLYNVVEFAISNFFSNERAGLSWPFQWIAKKNHGSNESQKPRGKKKKKHARNWFFFKTKKTQKLTDEVWHGRNGRELSGMSYKNGKEKKRKQSATECWSHWHHIEPIQAVYLAYAVWR